MAEVVKLIQLQRIQQRTVQELVHVPVSKRREQIHGLDKKISREQVSECVQGKIEVTPVSKIMKDTMETIQSVPQELRLRTQRGTD